MSDETEPSESRDQRRITPLEGDSIIPGTADVGVCFAKAEEVVDYEKSQTYLGTEDTEKTLSPLASRCQILQRCTCLKRWWKRSCIARGLRLVRNKICKVLRAVVRAVRLRKGNTRR